ncbi:MAG TPA: ABC transporter permease [Rhodanobacter sp.]|nr:ABC transporter permease [Rhodanobacter sp.]
MISVRRLASNVMDAIRGLAHAPFYTLATIFILTVVLSVTSTVLSLNSLFLYSNLPYANSDHMVEVHGQIQSAQQLQGNARAFVEAWRDELNSNGTFTVAVASGGRIKLPASDEEVGYSYVDSAFFRVLGTSAKYGVTFDQLSPELAHSQVAVISGELAKRLFGDVSPIDRVISLDRVQYQIVGVMPLGFRTPKALAGKAEDVWVTLPEMKSDPSVWKNFSTNVLLYGRVKGRPDLAALSRSLAGLTRHLQDTDARGILPPGTTLRPVVQTLKSSIVGEAYRAGLLMLAVSLCLALLGLSITGTLLMSRMAVRRPTLAVHMVVGATSRATRSRVATEVLCLVIMAALLAIPLNGYSNRAIRFLAANALPRLDELSLGLGSLMGLATLAAIVGVVVAWVSIRNLVGPNLLAELAGGGKGAASVGHFRAKAIVLGCQFFLIASVLYLSGFVLSDAVRRLTTSVGFREDRSDYVQLFLPSDQRSATSKRDLVDRLVPELTNAGADKVAPVDMPTISQALALFHVTSEHDQLIGDFAVNGVGRAYLEELGMHLLQGRYLNDKDYHDHPDAVVLGESAANLVGGGTGAVGQHILIDGAGYTVVGVVNDVINPATSIPGARLQAYTPFQFSDDVPTLSFFVFGDVTSKTDAIGVALRKAAPQASIDTLIPTAELRLELVREYYVKAVVSAVLVILAIVMAGAGTEAVVRYVFLSGAREIATKVAAGAQMRHLVADLAALILKPLAVALVVFLVVALSFAALKPALLKLTWLSLTVGAVATSLLLAIFVYVVCQLTARRIVRKGYIKLLQVTY